MSNTERTEIGTLGEFGLIDFLTRNNETRQAGTMLGTGDDAAVIDTFGKQVVLSTDMLVEGVHFDLTYTPLKHLGYKAVAVNLSDICAMGAVPTHITVSIGLSNRFSVEAVSELYEGIYAACSRYNVDLAGGDTTSSFKGLLLSITAVGEVAPGAYITRSGARKNDLICVSGDLGGAYLGLQLLEREKKIFLENPGVQPDVGNRGYVIGRILKPEPRTDIVEWLREQEIVPTSMIDISDGLSSELMHLCRQSGTGCVVYEDKLPVHEEVKDAAQELNLDPTTCVMNGGEDYELLFTIRQEDYEKVASAGSISVIGYMTEEGEGLKLETRQGNRHALQAQGWNAFGEGK